jgi:hypothetical protein
MNESPMPVKPYPAARILRVNSGTLQSRTQAQSRVSRSQADSAGFKSTGEGACGVETVWLDERPDLMAMVDTPDLSPGLVHAYYDPVAVELWPQLYEEFPDYGR